MQATQKRAGGPGLPHSTNVSHCWGLRLDARPVSLPTRISIPCLAKMSSMAPISLRRPARAVTHQRNGGRERHSEVYHAGKECQAGPTSCSTSREIYSISLRKRSLPTRISIPQPQQMSSAVSFLFHFLGYTRMHHPEVVGNNELKYTMAVLSCQIHRLLLLVSVPEYVRRAARCSHSPAAGDKKSSGRSGDDLTRCG